MDTLITLLIGFILLFAEHRTGWFQKTASSQISKRAKNLSEETIEITSLDLAIKQFYWIIGTLLLVSPVAVALAKEWHDSQTRQLQERIDVYEQSSKWELPQTLNKLNTVSEQLSITIEEREKLESFQKSNDSLARDKSNLEARIKSLQQENAEFFSQLSRLQALMLESQAISLEVGKSVNIAGGVYKLGNCSKSAASLLATRMDFRLGCLPVVGLMTSL